MNRQIFLYELRKELRRLPAEEIENTIAFYDEYFSEAGSEHEQEILAELGSPKAVAAKVIGEFALSGGSDSKKTNALWMVILAVCASPIALPLVIIVIAVVFALVVSLFAVGFSLAASGAAITLAGVVTLIAGFVALFLSPATGLLYIGTALFALSAGILLVIGMVKLCQWGIFGIQRLLGKFLLRRGTK